MPKPNSPQDVQIEIELPDKKYFTIGEVAELCDLKSHVLRYWEQVFPQLEPSKRSGRRYYQRNDVELILEIKSLLHHQGFTIPGAKARLAQNRAVPKAEELPQEKRGALEQLQSLKSQLQSFRNHIKTRY
ncbi:MerR family transcriptional regulator [Thiomicrorhabdus cannonii]|uniref:MerR family transcriptional regulator n=1 Tax=Thiomicrorhabdus cannonii TaxID=2748011 RepID=UPI0015BC8D3B|nr:MerR family transcriptional regulator [Thiomicrorhabdus cannonii]